MLVTNLAYRDMEVRSNGLVDRLGQFARRFVRRSTGTITAKDAAGQLAPGHQAHVRLLALHQELYPTRDTNDSEADGPESIEAFRWRRHPQLLNRAEPLTPPDADDLERRARSAAVRGLFLARSGRYDGARSAFAAAASERSVDLTAIPGFWDLPRSGMLAAVGAYDDVRRFRDASALGARIRLAYRPRSISAVPDSPETQRSAAGS